MKKTILLCISYGLILLLTGINSAIGQIQNSLSFDGNDDLVTSPGASALIANSNNISLAFWAYPTNPTPSTTSYDGFCGLRNNSDCDFYVLHYTATTVEARFRPSSGIAYDISGSGIVLNTWQHITFTYDGIMLRYYHNGIYLDSLAASGVISNSTETFYMGGLPFSASIFNLVGKLDEVGLWNKTLSQSEINCIYNSGIDTSDTNLQLCYKLNQGTANGNNTGLTTAIDATGNINGTLNNFTLNGSTSNWVAGVQGGSSVINAGICAGDSYSFNGQNLTSAGTYSDTLVSSTGCDSIVTLNLTVSSADTSVALFSTVLHSNQAGAQYQWVDCNNGYAPISGATSQNYAVTIAGSYACIVNVNGCIDTSSCHTVTFAGIADYTINDHIKHYPNPIENWLHVEVDPQLKVTAVEVTDLNGKVVYANYNLKAKALKIDATDWANGIYSMKIITTTEQAMFKLVKN